MKKLLVCCLLFIPIVSNAWTDISKFIIYTDILIDENKFTNSTAWIKYHTPKMNQNNTYAVAKIKYSCEKATLGFQKSYNYNNHGEVIHTESFPDSEVIPNSFGEYILERVCNYKKYNSLSNNEKICLANSEKNSFHDRIVSLCGNELGLDGFESNVSIDEFTSSVKELGCQAEKMNNKDYINLLVDNVLKHSLDISSLSKQTLINYCNSNKEKFLSIDKYYKQFK